jgi:hypothetical protein
MKKNIGALIAVIVLLASWTPVHALPPTLSLPVAADHAPVIDLGNAVDPGSGILVHGYAIVHYRDDLSHHTNSGNGSGGGNGTNSCYGFLASGAKWKTVEPWIMNPSNTRGLDPATAFTREAGDISKWEDAADGVVGSGIGVNIVGDGTMTSAPLTADTSLPDGENEVYFADVSSPGAIAVTIVWGIFSGPPSQRKLVEWDQVFDDADYDWSLAGEPNKMDFENISTHELGHAVGLSDLYQSSCAEQTMYGYANVGETNKRTLESGDITGVSTLY